MYIYIYNFFITLRYYLNALHKVIVFNIENIKTYKNNT